MKSQIEKLREKEHLSRCEMEEVLHVIMSGKAPEEDIAEFLLALNDKGPTIEEITGAAAMMRKFFLEVKTHHEVVLDTCGTGGDQSHTFNISTVTAFVVSGAGVTVAKHGNRSVSSRCGSADVLEMLGVRLDLSAEALGRCLDEIGMAFLFAQKLHPAMKHVAPVRKALGVRTIFNILGPLSNPAQATHQLMGIYSRELVEPMAHVLKNLGLRKALVVNGSDGLDEVTTTGLSFIAEWNGQEVITYDFDPQEMGIPTANIAELKCSDKDENVQAVMEILKGVRGPKRDIVVLNAACALYAAEKIRNIGEGIRLAEAAIDSGRAREKLEQLRIFTQKYSL